MLKQIPEEKLNGKVRDEVIPQRGSYIDKDRIYNNKPDSMSKDIGPKYPPKYINNENEGIDQNQNESSSRRREINNLFRAIEVNQRVNTRYNNSLERPEKPRVGNSSVEVSPNRMNSKVIGLNDSIDELLCGMKGPVSGTNNNNIDINISGRVMDNYGANKKSGGDVNHYFEFGNNKRAANILNDLGR